MELTSGKIKVCFLKRPPSPSPPMVLAASIPSVSGQLQLSQTRPSGQGEGAGDLHLAPKTHPDESGRRQPP